MQGETIRLVSNSEQTYTVIVRRTETAEVAEISTVLESQDQELVDDVNSSMREDTAAGRSSEKYDYKSIQLRGRSRLHGGLAAPSTRLLTSMAARPTYATLPRRQR
jgi:hypothetical protein